MTEYHDRDLLIVIHDVARTMRTHFDKRARAAHAMTRAQWVILSHLDRQPGMSQNEMAAVCEVEPITVARLIDRLEARGMVERRADPHDRRIKRLHLLAAARPLIETIKSEKALMSAQVTAGMDAATQETLIDALLKMKENLANETQRSEKLAQAGE
jgi:MarR family transcriptional regulator, transcriptional regulator for hemolysin